MQKAHLSILITLIILGLGACSPTFPEEVEQAYQALPYALDYNQDIKPILSDRCFACHGNDQNKLKAGLRLDYPEYAFAELPESPGKYAIKPYQLNRSELVSRILSDDSEYQMPPTESNLVLSAQEKALLIKWIEEGAVYQPHWAFQSIQQVPIPKVKHKAYVVNPIDNFVLNQVEKKGLIPSVEAKKGLLLRRLSLDLTGLPPSLTELETFFADTTQGAYEKQVDRLLESPHYGEKMATDWMDVARFSDTYGYQVDRFRDMSPWRDWVISAFNENMPYDQFLTWQLAGDLMPNASKTQTLATAFNRLHPLNMEDGIVDEEFRVESVADRVAVLGDGILGLTLSCARCHDHKYDPITQKEYYQLFSFFNNINETGQISWDEGTPVPTLLLPSDTEKKQLAILKNQVEAKSQKLRQVSAAEQEAIRTWINEAKYQDLPGKIDGKDLDAHFTFDQSSLQNKTTPHHYAYMEREFSAGETPEYVSGYHGKGLKLNGDAWLNLNNIGKFKREDPFSVGLWVFLPSDLAEGVLFHKNKGTQLHAYRGFHLYLQQNKLQWVMAHTYPENAIILMTRKEIPKEEWVHLMVTYDGSSSAQGTRIYLNGEEMSVEIEQDNLYKDIIFHDLVDIIYPKPIEPNIKVGGRWRGKGLTDAWVDEIRVYNRALSSLELHLLVDTPYRKNLHLTEPISLHPSQRQELGKLFLAHFSPAYQSTLDELHEARHLYVEAMEEVQEIMVMKEMDKPRKTHVLNRGVYDDYGEPVSPNTPASLMKMPDTYPKNRLGLARWVTHPDHPLTARVAVNRYWKNLFGRGLVETVQDFGNQGALPTHPELLDWLAIRFKESQWDVKALHKLMVMSATYRQTSISTPELRTRDPDNICLARGPSRRLTSEMIRDNALAASGLLNRKVGGKSVYPYQPEGLWAMNFDPYIQDMGEKLYRRSMYTMWRRTIPNPTLATFDQPNRDVCTVNRQKTNTPLQALVLLNDPTFLEATKVMGEKMARIADPSERIRVAFTELTGKSPSEKELHLLLELGETEYKRFKDNPGKSNGWLDAGAYVIDPSLDAQLVAANAVVASVILNGDVAIMKR